MSEPYINSSKKYDWVTPDDLFYELDDIFGFTLDAAADEWNAKCEEYLSQEINALEVDWDTEGKWFLNPPWGRQYTKDTGYTLEDWLSKATLEFFNGYEGVMLVPENLTSIYMNKYLKSIPYILIPEGRIKFVDPNRDEPSQPTKGTIILIFVRSLDSEQINKLNRMGCLVSPVISNEVRERWVSGGFKGYGVP